MSVNTSYSRKDRAGNYANHIELGAACLETDHSKFTDQQIAMIVRQGVDMERRVDWYSLTRTEQREGLEIFDTRKEERKRKIQKRRRDRAERDALMLERCEA